MTAGLAAWGAGGDDSPSEGGKTVTVLVEGGGKAELEPVAGLQGGDRHGGQARRAALRRAVRPPRGRDSSGSVSFDIAALDAIWLRAFADGVEPLDELFTDEVKATCSPRSSPRRRSAARYVGMPIWTNSEILFYRTDLFEDPKSRPLRGGVRLPTGSADDWEQYPDIAEFFTQDTDGDGTIDLYGTDVKGAVETEWLAHVSQAGAPGMVLDEDGEVMIDNAEHLAALGLLHQRRCMRPRARRSSTGRQRRTCSTRASSR